MVLSCMDPRFQNLVHNYLKKKKFPELKVELFRLLAEELEKQGVRKEDLFISITPTQPEDWSFGNGVAQLLQEDADSKR